MTFQEMYEEAQSYLADRGDYADADAQDDINRAYRRLCNAFSFYESEDTDASITTADGTASYDTPSDVVSIVSIKITGDTEYTLTPQIMPWYERQDTTDDNKGIPEFYIRHGSKLYLWPTPDDEYSLRIRHEKPPTALAANDDEPVIPEEWHEIIVLQAASRACFRFGMAQRGQELKNEALGMISGLQEQTTKDARYRIGQMRLQRTRRSSRLGYPDPDYAETP